MRIAAKIWGSRRRASAAAAPGSSPGPGRHRHGRGRVRRGGRGRADGAGIRHWDVPGVVPLDQLRPGQRARVVGFCEGGPVSRRLAELGLLPGRIVHYLRDAPLRDPIEIKIGASFLSLRRLEAARVMVVADEVSL